MEEQHMSPSPTPPPIPTPPPRKSSLTSFTKPINSHPRSFHRTQFQAPGNPENSHCGTLQLVIRDSQKHHSLGIMFRFCA